jgi:hypothetical protein
MEHRNPETGRFLPGHHAGGRPRGSRQLLASQFIADLYREWEISGAEALKKVVATDPSTFCKLVGSVLPKDIELHGTIDVVDHISKLKLLAEAIGVELNPRRVNAHYPRDLTASPVLEVEVVEEVIDPFALCGSGD